MITDLSSLDALALETLAQQTLVATQENSPLWMKSIDDAREELAEAMEPNKIALAIVDERGPLGWVGAMRSWGCVWELHPLIIGVAHQRGGHGRTLVRALEERVRDLGILTLVLGTSDETGATSLSNCDLYDDTPTRLANAVAHRPHPMTFWQRVGYKVIGVVPDAEGPGKPSITLAKRLQP